MSAFTVIGNIFNDRVIKKKSIMAFYQFRTQQLIPSTLEEVWDFVSSPANLKKITPPRMGFDITSGSLPEKMYRGMIIAYKVRPVARIRTTWVTEITHIEEGRYFVDEQRIGPYALWHHEHFFEPIDGGVLMRDIVSYKPPMGFLGALANAIFIRRQLKGIFAYRHKAVEALFGEFEG